MKYRSVISMMPMITLCTACTTGGPLPPTSILVSQTAAQKALGSSARYANLLRPGTFAAGRIFHVKQTGEVFEICENDFRDQNALKAMEIKTTAYPKQIAEDRIRGKAAINVVGGIRANMPYKKIKVTGYEISQAKAPTGDGNVVAYIESNIAKKCKTEVLPRNKPYYIVTAVATADKAEVTEQPILSIDRAFGLIEVEAGNEVNTWTEENVIFGINAKKVAPKK